MERLGKKSSRRNESECQSKDAARILADKNEDALKENNTQEGTTNPVPENDQTAAMGSADNLESSLDREEDQDSISRQVVGVLLADGKVLQFDPQRLSLEVGDQVLVENERDLNLGKVVYLVEDQGAESINRVIRRVGTEDVLLIRRNKKREEGKK